jgi:hypothetical protein
LQLKCFVFISTWSGGTYELRERGGAMSYMKWAAHIRESVKQMHANGMLGVLAARTHIPEYRLRDWVTLPTIDNLSHTEMTAIEGVINAVSTSKGSPGKTSNQGAQQRGCQSCEDNDISFDQSD